MHITNRFKQCCTEGCDRHVYAKDLCRRHYSRKRWHLDYENERKRKAIRRGRNPDDVPRRYGREPNLYTREDRLALLERIMRALNSPAGGVCQVDGCGRPAHHNGASGVCKKHYERERALRMQLDMPREDRRFKTKVGQRAQAERDKRVGTDELTIRREAARRGVTPGVVAKEMGVNW